MGDRAQIAIKQYDGSKVYLYAHWSGSEAEAQLKDALKLRTRWDDSEYLARIIFCKMMGNDRNGTTGFGIGTAEHSDVSYPIPVLNCETQTITWEGPDHLGKKPPVSFEDFIGS